MSLQKIHALHAQKHNHKHEVRKKIAQVFAQKHNQKRTFLRLKKKRPLWKEVAILATTSLSVWGISHVGLNLSAYAQIIDFKAQQLTASLFERETAKAEPVKLVEKVGVKRKTFEKTPETVFESVIKDLKVYPSDNRIILPRIGKNVPLIQVDAHRNWNALETNIQKGLQNGVVVHPISHQPGNFGNFFVTGHSSYYTWDKGRYKDVFALLHELKEGDKVEVHWKGKKYTYLMEESRVIPPTEVSVLDQPTDQKTITLMTCTPIGTNTNRLIWTGTLIEVE